jgi:hypothetical protein
MKPARRVNSLRVHRTRADRTRSNSSRGDKLAAIMAALIVVLLALAAGAQTTQESLAPPSLFVASSADAVWLVRQTLGPDKDSSKWAVLRRVAKPASDEKWALVATLTQRPRAVASFGDRLAVLYPDGEWSLVSSTGQMAGPPAPATMKLVSLIGTADRLTFLARSASDPRELHLITFDGSQLSEPQPAKTTRAGSMEQLSLAIAGPGAALVVEDDAQGDVEDVAQSADGRLQAFRRGEKVTLLADGKEMPLTLPDGATGARDSGGPTPSRSSRRRTRPRAKRWPIRRR